MPPPNKILTPDSTLVYLLIACCFITIWLAGAGWINVERIAPLMSLANAAGIGSGLFSLARSFRSNQQDNAARMEDMRLEMQGHYRHKVETLAKAAGVTVEQLEELAARQTIEGNT